jgi:hypothetical protein
MSLPIRLLLLLLSLTCAACATAGGPSMLALADEINATLEPTTSGGSGLAVQTVSILGEVAEPGAIELETGRRLTLIEAIARAGGHEKETAYLASTVLVRWDPVHQEQLAWTIDARQRWWGKKKTIFLQPYDLVYVPNTPIDDVGIWVDNWIRRLIPIPFGFAFTPGS